MAPIAVYLVISGSLTLGVCTGVILRVALNRARLRRRFGPLYGELVARHGGRRGRAILRAASDRFDQELEFLLVASLPAPSGPAAGDPPAGDPPAAVPPGGGPPAAAEVAPDPAAEEQVRPSPEP